MLVDGADPERIRELLEVEIDTFEDEWRQSAKIWESAGGYSPTIGILGAVMGLIHVMENLSDPTKLGAGIAVAFVATIYGVGLANLVYLPIAGKLKYYIGRMVATREMLIDGLVERRVGPRRVVVQGDGFAPVQFRRGERLVAIETGRRTPPAAGGFAAGV